MRRRSSGCASMARPCNSVSVCMTRRAPAAGSTRQPPRAVRARGITRHGPGTGALVPGAFHDHRRSLDKLGRIPGTAADRPVGELLNALHRRIPPRLVPVVAAIAEDILWRPVDVHLRLDDNRAHLASPPAVRGWIHASAPHDSWHLRGPIRLRRHARISIVQPRPITRFFLRWRYGPRANGPAEPGTNSPGRTGHPAGCNGSPATCTARCGGCRARGRPAAGRPLALSASRRGTAPPDPRWATQDTNEQSAPRTRSGGPRVRRSPSTALCLGWLAVRCCRRCLRRWPAWRGERQELGEQGALASASTQSSRRRPVVTPTAGPGAAARA